MSARQTSLRILAATDRQIEALQRQGWGSITLIVRVAIDRMYQDEIVQSAALPLDKSGNLPYNSVQIQEDGK